MSSSKAPQPRSASPLLRPNNGSDDTVRRHARTIDPAAVPAAAAAAAAADADALNHANVHANSAVDLVASPVQFRSYTIAPSPPPVLPGPRPRSESPSATHRPETANGFATPSRSVQRPALSLQSKSSAQSLRPVSRTPSLKARAGAFASASAASSAVPSPVISAMGDVTPLPSPLLADDSPGPWKKLARRTSRESPHCHPPPAQTESTTPTMPPANTRKAYAGLTSWPAPAAATDAAPESQEDAARAKPQTHTRNRSVSEYIPDPMLRPKRTSTVSGARVKVDLKSVAETHMRREPHLSEARGLTPIEKPPTPPPSESSLSAADSSSGPASRSSIDGRQTRAEYFEAYGRYDKKRRRWRALRVLGQGTFSKVILATSHTSPSSFSSSSSSSSLSDDEECGPGSGSHTPDSSAQHPLRSLVAVKICEHGPRGGASENRIEMSLKRELEIMQSIRHPSLVNLKAWSVEPTRAILVLSYYPGGDLFEVASAHRQLLTPRLVRRIFSELVGAVRYLHGEMIVHRDIKLENVLVNLPAAELASATTDWSTYPYAVVTLTDLGLSRRIADDERLETRCGSDDYAAPEVIMGQPYDGRATDAWSLGVLLYALLEARLPFDPPPGLHAAVQVRMRSRTSHRIARVEWRWFEYGVRDDDNSGSVEPEGDHEADPAKFDAKGLRGAMEVVEGLLKRARSRWPLARVAETEWVRDAIRIPGGGGIRFRAEEEGEVV